MSVKEQEWIARRRGRTERNDPPQATCRKNWQALPSRSQLLVRASPLESVAFYKPVYSRKTDSFLSDHQELADIFV